MKELMDMICKELEEIEEKGELSAGDLDTVYKLIMAKEKLMRIDEIEGYSAAGDWNAMGTYGGYSGRRRDSMGRYSRRRYSMDGGKERLIEMMESEMRTLDGKERRIIEDALNKLR